MSRVEIGPVLVTGGGGFLGTALIQMLRERGLPVRSLARRYYRHLHDLGAEQVEGDIADPRVVAAAVEGRRRSFTLRQRRGSGAQNKSMKRRTSRGLATSSQPVGKPASSASFSPARPVWCSTAETSPESMSRHLIRPVLRPPIPAPRRAPNSLCSRPTARTWPPSRFVPI